jgi:drug/metabolite transporter (DMT)-like permease
MDPRTPAPRTSALVAALLATWLIWGSTFIAIHYAVESMPPLLMMGSRFVLAGVVALAVGLVWVRRSSVAVPRLDRAAWSKATLVGIGLVTIGMGATGWAATRLPTGIAALLVASAPLWIAAMSAVQTRRALPALALAGLAIGIAGVAILVAPGSSGGAIDPVAALVIVASNAAWAAASLFAARTEDRHGLLLTTGMQMLTGGLLLTAGGAAVGELARLDVASITPLALGGWAYLVSFGSLGGFLAYAWLLERASPSIASTHAFVNPLVAVALGAIILGEQVGGRTLVAAVGVVIAVILLMAAERTPRPAVAPSVPRGLPARPRAVRRGQRGWAPTPTPAFAARRVARPLRATDGMDALAIDAAMDAFD